MACRTLAESIDHIANNDPSRPWTSLPVDDDDLSNGFRDISYGQLARMTDHVAHWLRTALGPSTNKFERFAYEGPRDIRWPVLAVAAAKVEKVMLLPSTQMLLSAKMNLFKLTDVRTLLFAEDTEVSVDELLRSELGVKGIPAPSLQSLIDVSSVSTMSYSRPWCDAKNNPWLIFHTSGTTGTPKPVVYTQLMMTSIAQSELFPDAAGNTAMALTKNERVYSTTPFNHLAGITAALPACVYLGTVLVVGPSQRPPTPQLTSEILQYAKVTGFKGTPFMIQGICHNAHSLELLKELKFIQWSGARLDEKVGNLLASHSQLSPGMGSTECGILFTYYNTKSEDWSYYTFRDYQGIEFESIAAQSGHYELQIRRSKQALWQQIFLVHPELNLYRTGDIFTPHPSKFGLWRYVGRKDDMISLSNGAALQVSHLENIIMSSDAVSAALIGGQGRVRPFMLVELMPGTDYDSTGTPLSLITKEFVELNDQCSDRVKIPRQLIILGDKLNKPFRRNAKQSVLRYETFLSYEEEINAAYEKFESTL